MRWHLSLLQLFLPIVLAQNWVQWGNKLIGTGANGTAIQGFSVALATLNNGNRIFAVGGPADSDSFGAVWIYEYNENVGPDWEQKGPKLIGTGEVGAHPSQGQSVALSKDGGVLAVGATFDNNPVGAVWVFLRNQNDGTYIQDGNKLVGTDYALQPLQGTSVALNGNGNTLAVGGNYDNNQLGATWIFTRTGSTWVQQGNKLVGESTDTNCQQGTSVSLNYIGNTLAVGGPSDDFDHGAVWVWVLDFNIWVPQGSKLVGTDDIKTPPSQGTSVSLSSSGDILASGAPGDNSGVGAVWMFIRTNGVWSQYGSKLIGTDGIGGISSQGISVSLNGNGDILAVGGYGDDFSIGATWIFVNGGSEWTQQAKVIGSDGVGGVQRQGQSVALSLDGTLLGFGGPQDNSAQGAAWIFRSDTPTPSPTPSPTPGPTPSPAPSAWIQKGNKLVGGFGVGPGEQGTSVGLNFNATVLAVGGPTDNNDTGCVWIYNRDATNNWNFGGRLNGRDNNGESLQGMSLSLNQAGDVLAIGGHGDNLFEGACWVFIADQGTWFQQGNKLVGYGAAGAARQGWSVGLNERGTVLAVGGYGDEGSIGAVWVWTSSNNLWSQQGNKIVGTGSVGASYQGWAVALNGDGTILASGGAGDNNFEGAVWIFTHNGQSWVQDGQRLIGTEGSTIIFGASVALNNDGTILATGGIGDNNNAGAIWIFIRTGTIWEPFGPKLVGTGAIGVASQGTSVSLSSAGDVVAFGGYSDDNSYGASWVFKRSGNNWIQDGIKIVGTGGVRGDSGLVHFGSSVSLSGNGSLLVIGGNQDDTQIGAVWTFEAITPTPVPTPSPTPSPSPTPTPTPTTPTTPTPTPTLPTPTPTPTPTATPTPNVQPSTGLSAGAKGGITIAVLFGVGLLGGAYYLFRKRRGGSYGGDYLAI